MPQSLICSLHYQSDSPVVFKAIHDRSPTIGSLLEALEHAAS